MLELWININKSLDQINKKYYNLLINITKAEKIINNNYKNKRRNAVFGPDQIKLLDNSIKEFKENQNVIKTDKSDISLDKVSIM